MFCFGVAFGLFPNGVKFGLILLNCMLYFASVVLLIDCQDGESPAVFYLLVVGN